MGNYAYLVQVLGLILMGVERRELTKWCVIYLPTKHTKCSGYYEARGSQNMEFREFCAYKWEKDLCLYFHLPLI